MLYMWYPILMYSNTKLTSGHNHICSNPLVPQSFAQVATVPIVIVCGYLLHTFDDNPFCQVISSEPFWYRPVVRKFTSYTAQLHYIPDVHMQHLFGKWHT